MPPPSQAKDSLSPRRRSGERVRERGRQTTSKPQKGTPLPSPLPARPSRGEGVMHSRNARRRAPHADDRGASRQHHHPLATDVHFPLTPGLSLGAPSGSLGEREGHLRRAEKPCAGSKLEVGNRAPSP